MTMDAGKRTGSDDKARRLIALAAQLGTEKFAPRAERYDREAVFPTENYQDLREAGLLALCVPERHGGLGADYRTYCRVSAELGRHCGATALTFNMHVSSTLWTGALADDLDMTPEQRGDPRGQARRAVSPDRRAGRDLQPALLRGRRRGRRQGAVSARWRAGSTAAT